MSITITTPHNQHSIAPLKDYKLTKVHYCLLFTQWGDELNDFVVQDCKRTGKKINIQFVPEEQCISILGDPEAVNNIHPRLSDYIKYITRDVQVTEKIKIHGNNGNYNWKSVWVPVNKKKQSELQRGCAVLPINKKEGTCVLVGPQPQLAKYEEWFKKTYCAPGAAPTSNNQIPVHHQQQQQRTNQPHQQKSNQTHDQFKKSDQKQNNFKHKKEKLVLQDYSNVHYEYSTLDNQTNKPYHTERSRSNSHPPTNPQNQQPEKKERRQWDKSNQRRDHRDHVPNKNYSLSSHDDKDLVLETIRYPMTPYQACYLFTQHLRSLRKFADDCCDRNEILAFSDFNSRSPFIEIGGANQSVISQFKQLLDKALLDLEQSDVITIPEKWQLDNIVVPMDARRRHYFQKDCAVSFHTQSDQIVLVGRQPRLGIFESWIRDMISPPSTKSFKKIVLCDTNIYAHKEEQKYLEQLYARRDLVLAVAERVRSELDRMKSYDNDNAYRAREALRNVTACGLVKNRVLLQQDGQLPKIKFNAKNQDDEIVAYGIYLREVFGKKIALVSRDAGMKQRAQAYGDYFDIYPTLRSLLNAGESNGQDEVNSLVKELKKMNVSLKKTKPTYVVVKEEVMSDDGDENWEDVSDQEESDDNDDDWEDVSDDDE